MRPPKLALVFAWLGAACSSSSSGGQPPSAALTPTTLPDAFAHAACDGMPTCCGAGWSLEACLASWRLAAPKEEAPAARHYDPAAAKACVDAMRASRSQVISAGCKSPPITSLDPLPAVTSACALVYTGDHAAGEPCSSGLDCLAGLACGRVDGSGTGVCRSLVPGVKGGPCGELGAGDAVAHVCDPAEGLFCDVNSQRCTPWLPKNAPCQQLDACGPDLMCDEVVCAPRTPPGSACCWPFACTSGYCGKDGVCAAPDAIPLDAYCSF